MTDINEIKERVTGHTGLLALIGSPVGHSGSPAMYNYSFARLGLDYVYVAFDVKEDGVADYIKAMRLLNMRGGNVTMPDKIETAKYMDACKDVIKKWGVDPLIINIPGETHMESIMYGIILGDYVSLYVAELQKKDPNPVNAITEFKEILKNCQ